VSEGVALRLPRDAVREAFRRISDTHAEFLTLGPGRRFVALAFLCPHVVEPNGPSSILSSA
jgi:hypothetical protein